MRVVIIIAFVLALGSATAASPSHIQAAESVFDLMPPATHIKQIYGEETKFPRPSSDVFFTTYRTAFVKELSARYSVSELVAIAHNLAESETIDKLLLEDLNQPAAISLHKAIKKIADVQNIAGRVEIISTVNETKNGGQD